MKFRRIKKSNLRAGERHNKVGAPGSFIRVLKGQTVLISLDDAEQFVPLQAGQAFRTEKPFQYVTYYSEADQGEFEMVVADGEFIDNTLQILDSNINVTLGGLAQVVPGPTPLDVVTPGNTALNVEGDVTTREKTVTRLGQFHGAVSETTGRVRLMTANANRKKAIVLFSYTNLGEFNAPDDQSGSGFVRLYPAEVGGQLYELSHLNPKFELAHTGEIWAQAFWATCNLRCYQDV